MMAVNYVPSSSTTFVNGLETRSVVTQQHCIETKVNLLQAEKRKVGVGLIVNCASSSISFSGSFTTGVSSFESSFNPTALSTHHRTKALAVQASASSGKKTLKVIISGAPASGKGTQCEDIVKKYGLTHISAGDLLRAEVAAGSENGLRARAFMDSGNLVPDDVVINMVKDRLAQKDAAENGWLLDGYPRSASQAAALEAAGIRPEIFILLEVPDDILVERVVGRRLDPVTGKIYHLTFSPPENEEIAGRLTQRSDDTEEKVKNRLKTHKENVESVLSTYKDVIAAVDGARAKDSVFADIDKILSQVLEGKSGDEEVRPLAEAVAKKGSSWGKKPEKNPWRGIPTKMNSIPHSREIRKYFYDDVCRTATKAVEAGLSRLKIEVAIPELNPEMDVYRIGTLMELIRELAFTFADDGKRVKVCVQGSMGQGIFSGMPLALAGTRRMLEMMDWGDKELMGTFVNLGAVGAKEVKPEDEIFIVMAPQNAVGNCIIDDLEAMAEAAGSRPFIIVNPRLKDLPGAGGVMQIGGRDKRLGFVASFFPCYSFRFLYTSGTQYPILGALRRSYPGSYEVYKRNDVGIGKEEYVLMDTFDEQPTSAQIGNAFAGRKKVVGKLGFWGTLSQLFA